MNLINQNIEIMAALERDRFVFSVCLQALFQVWIVETKDWKLKIKTEQKIEFVHPTVSKRTVEGKLSNSLFE